MEEPFALYLGSVVVVACLVYLLARALKMAGNRALGYMALIVLITAVAGVSIGDESARFYFVMLGCVTGAVAGLVRHAFERRAADLLGATELLRLALHDAIVSAQDIVPMSARAFYDPHLANQSSALLAGQQDLADAVSRVPLGPGFANGKPAVDEARGVHRKHLD